MNSDALAREVAKLVDAVLADPRWKQDDLGVAILGMISYGYALMIGRIVRPRVSHSSSVAPGVLTPRCSSRPVCAEKVPATVPGTFLGLQARGARWWETL